ncbi:MAG: SRPBCC domain-containing protein [Geminicoccaceae bacterium]
MTDSQDMRLATPGECQLTIARSFHAPRSLVFDCWTRPDYLQQWLPGPEDSTFETCEIDLRFGGHYRVDWSFPDGAQTSVGGVFREVVRPERLVVTLAIDPDRNLGEVVATLDLTQTTGRTMTRIGLIFETPEARDGLLRCEPASSFRCGCARLDTLLTRLLPTSL